MVKQDSRAKYAKKNFFYFPRGGSSDQATSLKKKHSTEEGSLLGGNRKIKPRTREGGILRK